MLLPFAGSMHLMLYEGSRAGKIEHVVCVDVIVAIAAVISIKSRQYALDTR